MPTPNFDIVNLISQKCSIWLLVGPTWVSAYIWF